MERYVYRSIDLLVIWLGFEKSEEVSNVTLPYQSASYCTTFGHSTIFYGNHQPIRSRLSHKQAMERSRARANSIKVGEFVMRILHTEGSTSICTNNTSLTRGYNGFYNDVDEIIGKPNHCR